MIGSELVITNLPNGVDIYSIPSLNLVQTFWYSIKGWNLSNSLTIFNEVYISHDSLYQILRSQYNPSAPGVMELYMNLERGAEAEPEPLEIIKPQIILQLCKLQNLSQNSDNSHHIITHQRRKEIKA